LALYIAILAAVVLAFAGLYLHSQRVLRRKIADLQQDLREEVEALKKAREASVPPTPAPVAAPTKRETEEEVSPEILLVIAAAVTTFLGKKVRIRSARALQTPYEIVNPWAQQGRVFVQASHNVAQRIR